jgi:hypothetical protein
VTGEHTISSGAQTFFNRTHAPRDEVDAGRFKSYGTSSPDASFKMPNGRGYGQINSWHSTIAGSNQGDEWLVVPAVSSPATARFRLTVNRASTSVFARTQTEFLNIESCHAA